MNEPPPLLIRLWVWLTGRDLDSPVRTLTEVQRQSDAAYARDEQRRQQRRAGRGSPYDEAFPEEGHR